MVFFIAAVAVAGLIVLPQIRFMAGRRKIQNENWEDLIACVEKVDLESIRDIADTFLNPTKDQLQFEPATIWEMLGGLNGLRQLSRNADAMLALCIYSERWDPTGRVISEMIRLDAINLKKAVRRVELYSLFGLGRVRGHLALAETAAHYELIRRRLLSLYEQTHVGRLPQLQLQLG